MNAEFMLIADFILVEQVATGGPQRGEDRAVGILAFGEIGECGIAQQEDANVAAFALRQRQFDIAQGGLAGFLKQYAAVGLKRLQGEVGVIGGGGHAIRKIETDRISGKPHVPEPGY